MRDTTNAFVIVDSLLEQKGAYFVYFNVIIVFQIFSSNIFTVGIIFFATNCKILICMIPMIHVDEKCVFMKRNILLYIFIAQKQTKRIYY